MDKIETEAWITRYALLGGIKKKKGTLSGNLFITEEKYPQFLHGNGKDWHLSFESALARAEKMRLNKIDSLKKNIAKLEKIKFSEQA